jgi:hypothetical protein
MTFSPTDKAAMLAELAREDTTVELEKDSAWRITSGRLPVGEGTTLDANGATITADQDAVRLWVEHPSVTITGLKARGYFTLYAYSDNLTDEDCSITHSLDGATILDHGLKGGATAAFMVWGRAGETRKNLIFRRNIAERTYHHGFSLNLSNAPEGGGYADVLYEGCQALICGKHDRAPRDGAKTPIDYRNWACGLNIPDAGDIARMTVRDCLATYPIQDGIHLDGSWTGHRQTITDVLIERCRVVGAGQRCSPQSVEKFWSGIYTPAATIVDCETETCRHAGIAVKNEVPNSLVVKGCVDTGSTYGMIGEYGMVGAKVEFTSKGALYRAWQGQVTGSGAQLDLTIIDPPKVACTFGRTARVDFLDCPGHEADVNGKYAALGYTIPDGAVTITAAGDLGLEVWPTSRMNLKAIDWQPLAVVEEETPDDVVPPAPLPPWALVAEDGCIKPQGPDGTRYMLVGGGFLPDVCQEHFPHGARFVREG